MLITEAIKSCAIATASFALFANFISDAIPAIEKANSGNYIAMREMCKAESAMYPAEYREYMLVKCEAKVSKVQEKESRGMNSVLKALKV